MRQIEQENPFDIFHHADKPFTLVDLKNTPFGGQPEKSTAIGLMVRPGLTIMMTMLTEEGQLTAGTYVQPLSESHYLLGAWRPRLDEDGAYLFHPVTDFSLEALVRPGVAVFTREYPILGRKYELYCFPDADNLR